VTREALWTGLSEAAEVVQAAVDEYEHTSTAQTRAVRDVAFRQYVGRLPLVIGNAEAGRYEARWAAYEEATQRVEQLTARLSLLPSRDAIDRQLQQQFTEEQAAAGTAFEAATVALGVALERARALDAKPDDKGGA
jgi:hypothetical protein